MLQSRTSNELLHRAIPAEMPIGFSKSPARRSIYAQEAYFRDAWRDFQYLWGEDAEQNLDQTSFVIFKPDALVYRSIGPCLRHLEAKGFSPTTSHSFRFDRLSIRELWRYELNIATHQRLDAIDLLLPATESWLVTLVDTTWSPSAGVSASERLQQFKGPSQIERREPHHLRSLIAAGANLLNNIHTPDDTAQLVRELGLLLPRSKRYEFARKRNSQRAPFSIDALEQQSYPGVPNHDLQIGPTLERIVAAAEELGSSPERDQILSACKAAEQGRHVDWLPVLDTVKRARLKVSEWDKIVFAASCTECDEVGVELFFPVLDRAAASAPSQQCSSERSGPVSDSVLRIPKKRDFIAKGDFVYREHSEPPVFHAASGSRLTDHKGRVYLDVESANGTVGLGYDASILKEASRRIGSLPGAPSFLESDIRLRTAERVAALLNRATGVKGRVAFDLGGAQAIELALKVARTNNREADHVVVFEGGYHGRSPYTSYLSSSARYRNLFAHGEKVVRLPYPNCDRCRFGQIRSECAFECVSFVQSTFSEDFAGVAGSHGVVAAVLEPILNVGGMAFPEPEYIQAVVRQARSTGALVIMDEIFTGLYRTGLEWGFQHYDFIPDMVVFSKAFSNGIVPISGVWARDPLMDENHFPPSTHSITYGNNPLGLAVVDVVLDRYERQIKPDMRLNRLETELRTVLQVLEAESHLIQSTSVKGAVSKILLNRPIAHEIRTRARLIAEDSPVNGIHGLILASTGMAPDVICIHPPLTIVKEDLETMKHLLSRTFKHMEAVHAA